MSDDLLSTNGIDSAFGYIKNKDTDLYNDFSDKRDKIYNEDLEKKYGSKQDNKFKIETDNRVRNTYDKYLLKVDRQPIIQNIINKPDDRGNQYFKEYKRTLMISSANRKRNMQCRTSNTNFWVVFGREYNNVSRIELVDFIVLRDAKEFWDNYAEEGRRVVMINLSIPYKNPDILGSSFSVQYPLMYDENILCPFNNCQPCYNYDQPNPNYYEIRDDSFTEVCPDQKCDEKLQAEVILANTTFGYARRRQNNEIDVVGDIEFYEKPLNKFYELKVTLLNEFGKIIRLKNQHPCEEIDIVIVMNIYERVTVLDNALLQSRTDNYNTIGKS